MIKLKKVLKKIIINKKKILTNILFFPNFKIFFFLFMLFNPIPTNYYNSTNYNPS